MLHEYYVINEYSLNQNFFYRDAITPVMFYGAECCAIKKEQLKNELSSCLTKMSCYTLTNRIKSKRI